MKRKVRSLVALLACAFVLALAAVTMPAMAEPNTSYQIYPTPHAIEYGTSEQTLRTTADVVVEKDIDEYTVDRLEETLDLKGMTANYVDEIPATAGTTSLLVGVKGSGGAVDKYVEQLVSEGKLSYTEGLFEKIDAYMLASIPGEGGTDQIIVLGKDTDAAFYGLTTLYQIFQQLNGAKLSAFVCSDYADVATRGFIEGYYGNPWSNEDRAELMTWGGYYKLNGYFYAPKNDPKHNSNWRELYTEEELETLIEPLAEAGNASKCRYLYALHPFMYNPITSANYSETLPILQEKFEQVIDHGVRQIAILADDAANQGNDLYIQLLEDMTEWIHEMQAKTDADGNLLYPGLKDTIVFIPVNYYGQGESWYAQLPENIEVGNTGGRIWGKVENSFLTNFKNNSGGKSPFMWINWPCSDNDKDALHMGGHNNFLGSDVKPGDVTGVVLNPMQQAEPSKQGLFMNADFSWNLWTSTEHADQTWEDSFSYIDHNSPIDNKGSNALRELSRHMLRMYGGGATWINGESSAIQEELTAFRSALTAGTVTADQCDEMIAIFEEIQQYAVDYRNNAGTAEMLEQMDPWISTWDDLTAAAIAELEAVKADLSGDTSTLLSKYAEGSSLLDAADNHSLWYMDHYEYARVGKAYIYPTVTALNDYVAERAQLVSNPDAMIWKFITNREDTPNGNTDTLFDGDTTTGVSYQTPNQLAAGTYFGYEQSKPFDLTRFTVTYNSANPSDTLRTGKLQVLREVNGEKVWQDVEGTQITDNRDIVRDFTGLDEKDVYGVRLIATEANSGNCWLTLREIEINKVDGGEVEPSGPVAGTVTIDKAVVADGALTSVNDNDDGTKVSLKRSNAAQGDPDYELRDYTQAGATVTLTFDKVESINYFRYLQTARSGNETTSGDGLNVGVMEYQSEDGTWTEIGDIDGDAEQTFTLETPVNAKAIRVVNGADTKSWWNVFDLSAKLTEGEAPAEVSISTNIPVYQTNGIANAADGSDETKFWSGRETQVGDYVMLAFGESKYIDTVRMLQGTSDCIAAADLYYTTDATPTVDGNWIECGTLGSTAEQEVSIDRVQATGIKFVVTQANGDKWFQLFELQAYEKFSYTKDNVWANFDLSSADVSARVGDGSVVGAGSTTLDAGQIIAIDLGSVRREVSVSPADVSATLVCSQNGLEWVEAADSAITARYIGFKASTDNVTVNMADLSATYLDSLDPTVEKSDLTIPGTYVVSNIFDGDPTTTAKTGSGPAAAGKAIVFDLGQERTINTIEYMVPDSTYDFIRNAVVEVADTPDAETWTQVLDINSTEIVEDNADTAALTAADATWMASSMEFPNVKYVSSADQDANLNATGRYLRIRFTGAYTNRWVEIGELRINGGEYVSTYAGGDFVSTVTEQEGMTPDLMIDDNLSTAWAPQAESEGTMTYHVSEPLTADGTAYEGVRIISRGNPTGATVKAVVYTDATFTETTEVMLGTLDQVSQEFRFGELLGLSRAAAQYTAVKDIKIEWTGETVPQIAEIYLLDTVKSADVTELSDLIAEAKKVDTSTWTTDSAAALADAITAAEKGVDSADYLTADSVSTLASALENAMNGGVTKYTGNLQTLVDEALTDGTGYTTSSWQAYQGAVADAKAALEDAGNLSQAKGDELAAAIEAAEAALAYDATAADRAEQAVADVEAVYTDDKASNYTTGSWNTLTEAEQAIKGLLAEGATPAEFTEATQNLYDAVNGLVDVTALVAERAAFEATDGTLYTDDSYAAYKKAYDDSAELLVSGSADQVAAAVTALQNAKADLELKTDEPGVDLDKVIADAEALSKDDYTTSSWATLQAAIDAAKADHDPAQDEELAKAITDAKTALVNVVALKNAIADAEALDTTDKTEESVAKLEAAIADAKALLEDGTQDDVNAAVSAIDEAVKGLVTETPEPGDKVDTSALEAAIAAAEALKADDYTAESWAELQAAVDSAKAALESTDQKVVDEAAAALTAAIDALDPVTDEPGTDEPGADTPGTDEPGTDEPGTDEPGTDEPGSDVTPGDDDQQPSGDDQQGDSQKPGSDDQKPSGDAQKPSTQKPSTSTGSQSVPNTGDASLPVAGVAIVAVILVAAGAILYMRNRKN